MFDLPDLKAIEAGLFEKNGKPYLINKSSKGEKGQYFSARYVIDMCVKMLNPREDESMIDIAAGSSGFPVHCIFKVWRDIFRDVKLPESHLFTLEKKPQRCYDYVGEKVFAIDFDEKAVHVTRCLNLIAGDGQTNVLQPFHYIEIGDLAADGAATSHVVPGEEAPSRATWIVQPGDVITSTVRPNRCLTGLIEPQQAENICSSGFAVLTPKGIPGELLFAYLRLPVICELMDLHTTASMYPAISTTDLMRLPFLLPDDATIKKVKHQITAARAARREAHTLLEKAKQAVEVAIEKNEAAGMKLLETK